MNGRKMIRNFFNPYAASLLVTAWNWLQIWTQNILLRKREEKKRVYDFLYKKNGSFSGKS